jgi:thiol-disulfide isomerase/thioredoxin
MKSNKKLRSGDEHYTIPETIIKCIKFFDLYNKKIWCPFCKLNSPMVIELKKAGNEVITTAEIGIEKGNWDFTKINPLTFILMKEKGYIVFDNPPFSIYCYITQTLDTHGLKYYLFKDLFTVFTNAENNLITILGQTTFHSGLKIPIYIGSNDGEKGSITIQSSREIFEIYDYQNYKYSGKEDFNKLIKSVSLEQFTKHMLSQSTYFNYKYSKNEWRINTDTFGYSLEKYDSHPNSFLFDL